MTKHTEGPWEASMDIGTVRANVPAGADKDSTLVASVFPCKMNLEDGKHEYLEGDREIRDANARLIAAAPTMIEMLVAIRDEHGLGDPLLSDRLDAVIAGATQ